MSGSFTRSAIHYAGILTTVATASLWLAHPCARADAPRVVFAAQNQELAPDPDGPAIEVDRELMGSAQWDAQARVLAEKWVYAHTRRLPAGHPPRPTQTYAQEQQDHLSKLVFQVLQFAQGVSDRTDEFESYFREQFLHSISHKIPGFAWFLVAEQSEYAIQGMSGTRYGGELGVQFPVLGSPHLDLKDGESQLVLRLMPVAGDYEEVSTFGPNGLNRKTDPDAGITLRPAAGAEATVRHGDFRPGFRLTVQPRATDPTQMRLIAEVYVNIDINALGGKLVKGVSVVPRCVLNGATNVDMLLEGHAPQYAQGYRLLNNIKMCSVNAEFRFGN